MEIFVSNIPYGANKEVIEDLFKQYGTVTNVYIPFDKVYRRTRGYGFISMPNEKEALDAINSLSDKKFDGRILKVTKSVKPDGQNRMKFVINGTTVKKETFERILGRQVTKEEMENSFEENISANMKIIVNETQEEGENNEQETN